MYIHKICLLLLFCLAQNLTQAQTSSNMTQEGHWDVTTNSYNDCWGYTDKDGNEYAIIGSRTKIHFLDISTPSNPIYLTGISGANTGITGANTTWRDIKTYENYAYSVADGGSEGLMVFDLNDLPSGTIKKVYQDNSKFNRAHNIYIDVPKAKLYVIGANNEDVHIYDLEEDPSQPEHLASEDVDGGYIHDAYVWNDTMYAASGYDGLYLLDFTTPTSPTLIDQNETPADGYNHSGWLYDNGDKYIVAEEVPQGLKLAVFDTSTPTAISFMDDFRHPVTTSSGQSVTYHNPYMIGDYAIISSYQDGLTIIDVEDPANTTLEAYYDFHVNSSYSGYNGCWGTYPFFPSQTIIASDIDSGLYVLTTTLTLDNTCEDGIKNEYEMDVDCGGFCKACECAAPIDIVAGNINSTLSILTWSAVPGASSYDIRYRIDGAGSWTVSNTTDTTLLITTTANSNYEFQGRTDCDGRLTGYHPRQTFSNESCFLDQEYTGFQSSGAFSAQNTITSTAILETESIVEYKAGQTVALDEGFSVPTSTIFEINMESCSVSFSPNSNTNSRILNEQELIEIIENKTFLINENPAEGLLHVEFGLESEYKGILQILSNNEPVYELESFEYNSGYTLLKIPLSKLSIPIEQISVKFK